MIQKKIIYRIVLAMILGAACVTVGFNGAYAQQMEKPALVKWKETGVVKVGWAAWFPFSYRDAKTNEMKGMLIDVFRQVADDTKLKVEFVEDSWGTFIAGLKANKFDVWSSANITIPRAMELGYTNGYLRLPAAFMVTKDWLKEHPNIKDMWDLDRPELTLAVTMGGRTDMLITKYFKKAKINRIKGSISEEVMELKSKRADAAFDAGLAILAALKEQPGLTMVKGAIGGQPLAIGVRQGDYVTTHFLNLWIDDAKREGVIKKLYEQHWGGIPEASAEDYLID